MFVWSALEYSSWGLHRAAVREDMAEMRSFVHAVSQCAGQYDKLGILTCQSIVVFGLIFVVHAKEAHFAQYAGFIDDALEAVEAVEADETTK